MRITFKLYATLADYLPAEARHTNSLALDVAEGSTIGGLIEARSLPGNLVHLVLVNGFFVPPSARASHALKEGDVLAIWPPIAGG
jgi:sulfur carrier protein ThiS